VIWPTAVILIVLGAVPCFFFGYLIGVKKQVQFISGYNPKKVIDPDGLAIWVGTLCNRIGILIVLLALGILWVPDYGRAISLTLSFAIMLVCLIYFVGARRYYKQPDPKDLPF